jgi:hypothetical protein
LKDLLKLDVPEVDYQELLNYVLAWFQDLEEKYGKLEAPIEENDVNQDTMELIKKAIVKGFDWTCSNCLKDEVTTKTCPISRLAKTLDVSQEETCTFNTNVIVEKILEFLNNRNS